MEGGHIGKKCIVSDDASDARILIPAIVRIPRKPKEIHTWNEDGLRWTQEGQGQE